jgi:flagellar biosynthesis protein FlhG
MQIWAVGGGKGGTGKSLIANGLGMGLAERGETVILVDADYGGPNQHTYCGLRQPATSLSDFFEKKVSLESLTVDTSVENLRLIPGNINTPNTDNITWTQKQKLFRHLRLLKADHVVLDLGAGSQYDTLDTFLLADHQIGVIVPDRLSIENFYLFLKNLKFRQLGNILSSVGLKERARLIWKDRAAYGITGARGFIQHLQTLSSEFDAALGLEQQKLFLHVVLNQVREYRQVEVGQAVKSSIQKYFQIDGAFAGYIRHDKDLWQNFGQEHPALTREHSFTVHLAMESVLAAILKNHPAEVH